MINLIKNAPANVNTALTKVIVARAKWETVKKIDSETKNEVLSENNFREEESGKRILDYKRDFLMSASDFENYALLVYQRNFKKGVDSGGADLTLWPIQKAAIDAEDEFIDVVTESIPQYTPELVKKLKQDHKLREKFLKIAGL
jgi:hypothetical protein